jgi:phage terminase large subunit-like protein
MAEKLTQKQIYDGFKSNIAAFANFFCKDLVTSQTPVFHKEIYDLVSSKDRLLLAAPRGFAKSSIVARIYPLHSALFKKHKDVVIISASESLAVEHLRWIKLTIEGSQFIKDFWGDLTSDKWTETQITVKHKDGFSCNIRAKGAGAQIRGFRPTCIILDDIETDDSVASEDQRRKLKGWLFKACLNSLAVGGQFVFIGTIIHPLAVINDLFSVPNRWEKRKFSAYKSEVQVAGNELWPELWSHERLQSRKNEIGTTAFASEFLNNPMLDENAAFEDKDIRYWEDLPKQYSCVMAIDPAYSEDEKADNKVCALVGIDQNMNRYLIDYIRTHDTTLDFANAILSMYQRNAQYITAVGCPNSGGDKEFFSSLMRIAEERKIYPPFVELKNTFTSATGQKVRNKHARIKAALQPLFENGKYYINPSHLEARDELLSLGTAEKDDLVDAMCYAETIITPQFFGEELKHEYDRDTEEQPSGYGMEY